MAAAGDDDALKIRVLCPRKSLISCRDLGIQWLIGSPLFLSPFTVVSALRCLHTLSSDPHSPDFSKESDELRTLIVRGFDVVGALYVGRNDGGIEFGRKAIEASGRMRKYLFGDGSHGCVGAVGDLETGDIRFFVSRNGRVENLEVVSSVVYEDNADGYIWGKGCLLRACLEIKLPVFVPADKSLDFAGAVSLSADAAVAKLKDPRVVYIVEGPSESDEASTSIVLHGNDLDFNKSCSDSLKAKSSAENANTRNLSCAQFCLKKKYTSLADIRENCDAIHVAVFLNQSRNSLAAAPTAEYLPAAGEYKYFNFSFKLDVLSYASEEFSVANAISMLIVPALVDQLNSIKKTVTPEISQCPQLSSYHFLPPGLLHPITAIYDLRYGETEVNQSEMRRCLHSRLGLPLDRPLLRTANALSFGLKGMKENKTIKYGSQLLKDVHVQIPSSGVSGGNISLISGSYEYYHYLVHGVDDNGWGCAYRSLQTIISWYRLQQYTSIEVPSHREIQQVLVEIGDKDPAFVGSREWIGAIELSFILDKLLGVSCKIINVRSGEELPEKCRELAMHFETQGTPIMIGGGVLAYTLLGVDYNELSGDCAFLILDPHYTGSDDIKKIISGGWCAWKKAVDSKGRNFFLKDKFYNLLLPQRPNMV